MESAARRFVLCKDVLQHLDTAAAHALIDRLLRVGRHVLFVNDRPCEGRREPRHGSRRLRPLNLSKAPFSIAGRVLYEFPKDAPWEKVAFLVHAPARDGVRLRIPKIIHHVWPGNDEFPRSRARLDGTSADFHAWRMSWMRNHPDWSFRFWRLEPTGDERMDALLDDPRYSVVVKSDVLRWFVLMQQGGLYVDTDFECLRPFDDLLETDTGLFLAPEPPIWTQGILCSSLVASVPSHDFAVAMFDEALRRLASTSVEVANARPNVVTGPRLVTAMAKGRVDITVHPSWMFCKESSLPSNRSRYAQTWWTGANTKEGWTHGPRLA